MCLFVRTSLSSLQCRITNNTFNNFNAFTFVMLPFNVSLFFFRCQSLCVTFFFCFFSISLEFSTRTRPFY